MHGQRRNVCAFIAQYDHQIRFRLGFSVWAMLFYLADEKPTELLMPHYYDLLNIVKRDLNVAPCVVLESFVNSSNDE